MLITKLIKGMKPKAGGTGLASPMVSLEASPKAIPRLIAEEGNVSNASQKVFIGEIEGRAAELSKFTKANI